MKGLASVNKEDLGNGKRYLKKLPAAITFVFLILFLVLVGTLLYGSIHFTLSPSAGVGLGSFIDRLFSNQFVGILADTFVVGLGTAALATVLAIIFTWIVHRTNAPGANYFDQLIVFPITIPPIVLAVGWIALLSPEYGLIQSLTSSMGYTLAPNIYQVEWIILILGLSSVPLCYFVLSPAIQSLPVSFEEASRISGQGLFGTVAKISTRMLSPAVASAFILVLIEAMANFEFVYLLGTVRGDVDTLTTEIYEALQTGVLPDYATAAILSVIFLVISIGAIIVYWWLTKKRERFEAISGSPDRQAVHNLGKYRYVGTLICALIIAGSFLPPVVGLVGMAFSTGIGQEFQSFTIENFIEFFQLSSFRTAFINTVIISVVTAIIVSILSFFISYYSLRSGSKFSKIGDFVSVIPLGIPPLVYGLAIFWMILFIPGLNMTYGTLIPLTIALIFVRMPHGIRITSSNLVQISEGLEEAGRVSGASWFRTFLWITVPLGRKGIVSAFLYTFINSMRELAAIILLISFDNSVYSHVLFSIFNSQVTALPLVSAGALIFAIIVFIPSSIILYYERDPFRT